MIGKIGLASVLMLGVVVGCGGGDEAAMPDVTGKRLDVAYSDLAEAGVSDGDVEVVGGGTFGVFNRSMWTVCEQRPAPGAKPTDVRLTVDRGCTR